MNMASGHSRACTASTPEADAGKDVGVIALIDRDPLFPLRSTGGNGLPVPINALPSVHRMMSAGLASLREVGFESGKIMGRLALAPWRGSSLR